MAAPQPTNRPRRAEVEIVPNIPVTIALKFAQGRKIVNAYGERMMLTTVDDKVFFCDLDVAAQIEALDVNVREPFTITKHTTGKKDAPVIWTVERPSAIGQQPDGTFAVPKLGPSTARALTESRAPTSCAGPRVDAASTTTSGVDGPGPKSTARTALVDEANALVDTFATVMERALTMYGGRVKPEEVRSLVLSAYIQRGKVAA